MDSRILLVVMLSFASTVVCAMVEYTSIGHLLGDPLNLYLENVSNWKYQQRVILKFTDLEHSKVESSMMYFLPTVDALFVPEKKGISLIPLISSLSCSCESGDGMAENKLHQTAMIKFFKIVLGRFADKGFKTVRLDKRLCKSPECLSSFISSYVLPDRYNECEVRIATELPHGNLLACTS